MKHLNFIKAMPILMGIIICCGASKAQLVNCNVFLQGNYVEVGVNVNGAFGTSSDAPGGYHPRAGSGVTMANPCTGICGGGVNNLGFVADPDKDGWTVGTPAFYGDYFLPGNPQEGWSIEVNGVQSNAWNGTALCGSPVFSGSLSGSNSSYSSSGARRSGTWQGTTADGIAIRQVTYLDTQNVFFTMSVTLRNTTSAPLANVYYLRTVDPDNDQQIVGPPPGGFSTTNTVVYQLPNALNATLVSATGVVYPAAYLGLGTLDCRAKCFINNTGLYPTASCDALYAGTSSGTYTGTIVNDDAIGLVFNLGTIAAGDSVSFSYAYVLRAADLTAALQSTIPTWVASGDTTGAHITMDTSKVCQSTLTTVSITDPGSFTWNWTSLTGESLSTTTGPSTQVLTGTTVISLVAVGTDACTGLNDTLYVNINPATPIPILPTLGSNSPICSGNVLLLNAFSGTPGVSYLWSGPGGFSSSLQDPVISAATLAATGIYTVTASLNGCTSAPATVAGLVNQSPSVITGNTSICTGSTSALSDSIFGGSWTSDNLPVATVDASSGVVTGVARGTATISYSIGACVASIVVTVSPGPSAVTGNSSVCAGARDSLSDATSGGTWSSSNTSIATIDGSGHLFTIATSSGTDTITYSTGGSCSATTIVTVLASPAAISPSGAVSVCVGITVNLTDGTSGGTWSSSNTSLATVNSTGTVTGVAAGTPTITYGAAGCSVTKTVTVLGPAPITPHAPAVCVGTPLTLTDAVSGGTWSGGSSAIATITAGGVVTAVGVGTIGFYYSVGGCLVGDTVTVTSGAGTITPSTAVTVCTGATTTLSDGTSGGVWISGNAPVATVNGSGTVTGVSAGTATISYVTGSCFATKVVTVILGAAAISPTTATVCTGTMLTLTDATSGGTWSSSATGIATITSGGVVSGVSQGTSTISYTIGSCAATRVVVVNNAPAAISPAGPVSICSAATSLLTDATTGGVWVTGNAAVATVNSSGTVTGVSGGSATITYGIGSCFVTEAVTVTTGPAAITTPATTICTGSTQSLSESVTGGTWSSSASGVATVTSGGLVSGVAPGTATISYAIGSCVTSITVTVNLAPTAGAITGTTSVCLGSSIPLADTASGGAWSSSNPSFATVSTSGVVTGVGIGVATISYTVTSSCGTLFATHTVSVNSSPSAGSIVGPSGICSGSVITLTNTVTGGTWHSSNGSASVNAATGLLTGISPGTDTITYTVGTPCGTAATTKIITVGTYLSAGTILGAASLCGGASATLTDVATGGTWSSSNSSAVVSSTGVVTGAAAGGVDTIIYTITASCGSVTATHIMAISPSPNAGTITGSTPLCTGSSATFTESVSGGVWHSLNSNATVTTGGVVTGMAAGIDTISYSVTNSCGTAIAKMGITIGGTVTAGTITGPGTVCTGAPVTLTESVSGGVWSTGNANATVSSTGLVTGVTPGADTIFYTVTTGCGTATAMLPITVGSSSASAGTITGPSGVCIGSPITFTDVVSGGVWSMTNGRATVTSSGVVSGTTAGTDTIVYTLSSSCGTASTTKIITIGTSAGAGSISGSSVVCAGSATPLTDGLTGGAWSSSNANVSITTGGVVTGITAGTSVISYSVTYSCGMAIATKIMTVNPSSGFSTISGPDTVCLGGSITLSDATPGGTWTSGNSNASVSGGIVTGLAAGTAPISYSVSTGCGTSTSVSIITIISSPLTTIAPISGLSIVCVGSGITLVDPTPGGIWVASNGHAAVVGAGIIDGVTPGVDTIGYMVTGVCGTAEVTKILSVDTIPIVAPIVGPSSQCVGSSITLTDPTSGGVWTTSTPSVGTVAVSSGVVTGLSAGTTTITYTVTNLFGCPGSVTITDAVTPPSITTGITGITSVCAGSSVGLSNATAGGSWSSSDPSVASIDPSTGIVVGVSTGSVTISYTITNSCGTSTVTSTEVVNSLPSVAAISGPPTGCVGSSVTLSDATPGGGWTSADASIATVNATTGEVTGTSAGTVNINYTVTSIFGCSLTVNTPILINPAPSVAPISGTAAECAGSATSLSDVTTGGVWSSSNPLIATVDASGTVSGIVPGSATISYSIAGVLGCTGSASVINIVNAIPVESPVTGVLRVCAGASSALSNSIPGGTWSSANASVAIVNATTGVVTGISAGTDEIYYSVSNSCGSALDSASVTVLPSPTVAAITAAYTSLCTGNRIDLTESTTGGAWGSTNASIATVTTAGVVTGVTAGVDTIYYSVTNSSGCSATAIVRIIVGGAMPSASVTPNSTVALCEGHTTTMHASSLAGISYQWMRNGTAIAGATDSSYTTSATGNYTVIISNGICSETLTGPSVVAPARPVVSFNPPDMLYTGTYTTYQWFKNGVLIPGANGNIIHETGGGVYTVVVTLAGGCSDTSVGYTVTGAGVTTINGSDEIRVYPNPATSIVHIDASEKISVSVLSVDGKLLMERKDATDIDISSLANGMYIIQIYDENKLLLKTAKFAKVE